MSHSYTVHSTHYWSDQCATGGGVGDINQGEHVHRESSAICIQVLFTIEKTPTCETEEYNTL